MAPDHLQQRHRELQEYVAWTFEDAARVQALGPLVVPAFPALIDDFYAEIQRHPAAAQVITGGQAQIDRLKQTLHGWLTELFSGVYDEGYAARRWRVGWRHVEVGLDQVFASMALARLRHGLIAALAAAWTGAADQLLAAMASLNKLLDLDWAIIEDAYQTELMRRLQQNERLATIGQVAAGVAHELRNPLNVIRTSVYYLLNARQPDPVKTQEHLSRIERQVGLADDVISALTGFAKLPIPQLRPVSVRQCLEEALESYTVPNTVQVRVECPDTLPPILADGQQLRIVLTNLIRNACEAMPGGGQLTLAAALDHPPLVISVEDTGHGIPADVLPRIMEPLYSTKARGIGLGLAIARSIVDKHGGKLHVTSEPGRGTKFSLSLPTADSE